MIFCTLKRLVNSDPGFDFIIVDTPPYLSNRLNELFSTQIMYWYQLRSAFLTLWPIKSNPGAYQIFTRTNHHLKAGIVLNMLKPRLGITAEVVELINTLGMPLLKTRVFDRGSLVRSSMTSGILKSTDQKAIEEILFLRKRLWI